MPRKTLKQKLKSQLRQVSQLREQEFQQAGITINYEQQAMQSVALAHGVMAALIGAKSIFLRENDADQPIELFKQFEEQCQGRIAQCLVQLVEMGITAEEANARILRGY